MLLEVEGTALFPYKNTSICFGKLAKLIVVDNVLPTIRRNSVCSLTFPNAVLISFEFVAWTPKNAFIYASQKSFYSPVKTLQASLNYWINFEYNSSKRLVLVLSNVVSAYKTEYFG